MCYKYKEREHVCASITWLMNAIQSLIMICGTGVCVILCAHFIITQQYNITVGDYALVIVYIEQLYAPLNAMGGMYRLNEKFFCNEDYSNLSFSTIQQNMVDMESMVGILREKIEVNYCLLILIVANIHIFKIGLRCAKCLRVDID
jgi:ABC-type transport system involved in Fe-S cluster assembly fused permease/ATPase subunit